MFVLFLVLMSTIISCHCNMLHHKKHSENILLYSFVELHHADVYKKRKMFKIIKVIHIISLKEFEFKI